MPPIIERILQASGSGADSASLIGMTLALIVSSLAAGVARVLYESFYESRETGSQIHRSFLLLGPSVTLLFIVVQLSLPLSLGLLGALSIVRFRVPIKEPEEIGFLMVVIACSIACATYSYGLLAILLTLVVALLVVQRWLAERGAGQGRHGGILTLTLRDEQYTGQAGALEALLRERVGPVKLEHLSGREGQTHLNYAFRGRRDIDWPGVTAAVRELCQPENVSVLFARQGGI